MNEKKRFNVEQHTTLDNRIIDVFPVSHQYIHKLENELKYKPDNEITLQDDKGNKFVLIQTERIDMQKKLNETIEKLQQENQQLKNQQKDFITFIEEEKNRIVKATSHIYEDELGKTKFVNEDVFNEINVILNVFKEITKGDIK